MLTPMLVFMSICNSLPCLTGGITDAVFLQINIGIIVDVHSAHVPERRTALPCNVTLEWHYVDFRELYRVFQTITILDQTRNDIDLLVLLDYDNHSTHSSDLLHTVNKRLIQLNSHSTSKNQTQLESLISTLTGTMLTKTKESKDGAPYCKTWANASHVTENTRVMAVTMTTAPSRILTQLVQRQGWKFISVLHDTRTEYETRHFVDGVSHSGTLFTVHNVDHVTDLYPVLFGLYQDAVRSEQSINIVVICSLECLVNVLHTANKFDGLNKEYPTLLKQFSRWVAVVYDYSARMSGLLQNVAHDLDNVAVLAVPELKPATPQEIVKHLRDISGEVFTQTFTNDTERKNYLLQKITRGLILLEPTSACSHYLIDTLAWKISSREFYTVGYADLDGEVTLTAELFPNTKYGYSRREFRVTTEVFEPYVSVRTTEDNRTVFGGIYIDMLTELARVLNFTYTIVLPPDGKWGSVDKTVNGTDMFNGMVGMLQRHEVDFAAAPLTIIPVRDRVVDFSYPVSYEYTTVIVKKPDPNALKWRTLLNPFKLEVLLYIGLSLPVVTLLVFLLEKFGVFYKHPDHALTRKQTGGLHHLHDAFWYMYGALLCQGGIRLPDSFAGRTFVSAWWIFCIIIVGTYCGNLIAFLTVSKVVPPFNSIEEMLAVKGQYKWGTQGGSVWETIFTTSKNPSLRQIGDTMTEFNESDPDIFHVDESFHRDRVKKGGYGWIIDVTTTELLMSSDCDLTTIGERILPMKDAFAFQQNSPHTAIFSQQIMKTHEAGLIEIWRRKWWPSANLCANSAKLVAKPITLLDVQSAYYVCLVGLFFGSVAFAAELLAYRCRKRRGGRDSKPESPARHAEDDVHSSGNID